MIISGISNNCRLLLFKDHVHGIKYHYVASNVKWTTKNSGLLVILPLLSVYEGYQQVPHRLGYWNTSSLDWSLWNL